MARTQAKNYDEVRQAILTRSADLFATQGFASTSIGDLAKANGISRGLLYHYFASKDALLDEMLNAHLDMMAASVRAAAAIDSDVEARFRNTVTEFVRINARSQSLQIVLLHDLQNLDADRRRVIITKQRKILQILRNLIADLMGAGVSDDELTARTMMCVGMLNYTYVWYDPDGPVGPDLYAQQAADTFLDGVLARQ
ncbi:TetR/AcrR family transcriptional regulator [Minwuia sp.]|uniref:TetR/AcrR family transcriptional regulator n=1 Tax=Minwuia sp. TaxID=2493630 RepID=UPI003A92E506